MQVIHTTKQPIQAQTDLVHLNQNLSYMAKDNKSLKLNEYDFIMKTCLYNVDPRKPHFYMVKLGFTGVYIIFLISAQNIDCWYSLELPQRGSSNEYPQSMF